jgi:PAS domain S-box-containing protein
MGKDKGLRSGSSELRCLAEERLRSRKITTGPFLPNEESKRLSHELQVLQVELEMQIEELLQARAEREKTEALLGKYSDLYDFAPVGYFNLDYDGIIRAVNLTGTGLLGVERSLLIGRRLDLFISDETRTVFHDFLDKVFASETRKTCEIVFQKERHSQLYVQVEAMISESREECRAVVFDITARKQAEEALWKSEEKYRQLFVLMSEGIVLIEIVIGKEGKPVSYWFLNANPALERLTHLKRKDIIGKEVREVLPGIEPYWIEALDRVAMTGEPTQIEQFSKDLNAWYEVNAYCPEPGKIALIYTNVTARKLVELERGANVQLLHLINQSTTTAALAKAALDYFRELSDCQAVGIRLKEGDDYPYYEVAGFTRDVAQTEASLLGHEEVGNLLCDSNGRPFVECMCGNVLYGRTYPSKSFFTPEGCLWTDSTTELLASATETDRMTRSRNICNMVGYESLALVPLRADGQTLGLLHFADEHKGKFSPEKIALWNRLADHLAMALSKTRAEDARKRAEEALRESEQRVKRKLERILDLEGDIGDLDLADIIDTEEIQAFMDDLYRLTGLKMSIIDLKGRVLVDVGWQDICLKFHRAHPETRKKCIESDTDLTVGIPPEEFRMHRCKNNLWHLVTPIIVGGRHMGNLFMGQFFFDDEQPDYELLRCQAAQYGFNEADYMSALSAVPRLSREYVDTGMAYFRKLAAMISRLSYSNIKLARSLAERDALMDSLLKSQKQNEFLADIVRYAAQPFGQGYPDGRLGLINNAFEQLTGYTYGELMTIDWNNTLTPPEWLAFEREKLAELQRSGKPVRYEKEYIRKDGTRVPIELLVHIVTDSGGNPQYYYSFITDITARKQAEEALKKLNEELENRVAERTAELREKDHILLLQSRQAAMGEMLGNIAHQWRQPLNAVGLTVQELLQIYDLGKLTREFLDTSVSNAMELILHMSRTIDDFRNYFRPEKEKVEFNVSEAIANTLSLVKDSYKNQHIGIEVVAKDDPVIYGFRNEFAQALLNILNNARDALTERGTDDPRVTITICTEGDRAVLTISDNAGGIPEEIMNKIFDPYFTTKGPQTGTGVGLFMSKTIIEKNMGGRLAASNSTFGAEFRIEV